VILPASAQTEKYAEPVGEDQYGSVYAVKDSPTVLTVHLDDNGEYILPSFINSTVVREQEQHYVLQQVPVPGTVFTCPQTVNVEIMDTSVVGEPDPWSTIVVDLVDATPPAVQLELPASTTPHTSFGGVSRYILPTAVIPDLNVMDACDAQPGVDVTLNGQPYQLGFPITEEGLHILQATVTDASGNESFEQAVFEIRPRPSITAAAVVDDVQYEIDDTGQVATLNVSVLVGSADFDPADIRLSSVRMMAVGADGKWLGIPPVPLRDAFDGDCPLLQHEVVGASINDCYAHLEFRAVALTSELPGPPVAIDILGAGGTASALAFEWGSRAAGTPDPNAANTLLGIIDKEEPCGGPQPPDPEPPLPCEVVETWVIDPPFVCTDDATVTGDGAACNGGGSTNARADTIAVGGSSNAEISAFGALGWCNSKTECAAAAFTMAQIQMVGDCCNCSITFDLAATVNADASIDGTNWPHYEGNASAGGTINMLTPCGNNVAEASAQADEDDTEDSDSGTGTVTCSVGSCSGWLIVDSSASLSAEAEADSVLGEVTTCQAASTLRTVAPNLNFTTASDPCPPSDDCPIDHEDP